MKHSLVVVCSAALLVAVSACAGTASHTGQSPDDVNAGQESALHRHETRVVEVRAQVKKINQKTRMVTLKGSDGVVTTFKAGDEIKRLNEIKAGDTVVVRYAQSLALELREPTEQEKKSPRTVVEAVEKSMPSAPPAIRALNAMHTIVTVEAIDRAAETVTVKGPKGDFVTVVAQDPKNLEKLKAGDTIAVTYTEALAISIEPLKTEKKKK